MENGLELKDFIDDIEDFLEVTDKARRLSERDRDYKDHKQWTEQEKKKLLARNQAAITVNRIRPKVEGLKGLLVQRKTDPKAYPRTPRHEEAAEVVTDGLRYVADNNDFDTLKLDVADNIFVEGYGAVHIGVEERGGDVSVKIDHIPWDRFYYDPHSRRLDFKDARFMGIILWMDKDHAIETFGLSEEQAERLMFEEKGDGDETLDDRPAWVDRDNDRVRICQHYFIKDGQWHVAYFSKNEFLSKPEVCPYVDEFGEPTNPIEARAANIDRDNQRFGEVRYWIDLQDEINHRRSKFLHLNSVRQTAGRKGAIADISSLKRELAKPDGHVEYNGEKGDFEVLRTGDMSEAQFALYQDGKGELDAVGFNAQLSGERQGDLSGRAITNLQQAALNELAGLYDGIANWEKNVYRQIWFRMKQFWTREKWIRVLDDESKLRWVGFNQQVTAQQQMEDIINNMSLPLEVRQQTALMFTQAMQAQDPRLQQIVEVKNDIAELDMDIIIETSLDSLNIQQEQFEELAKIAQTRPEIPFEEIIKMSALRSETKKKIIQSLERNRQSVQENNAVVAQAESAKLQAETQDKLASAFKKEQEGIQTNVQTTLLENNPPEDPSVVI